MFSLFNRSFFFQSATPLWMVLILLMTATLTPPNSVYAKEGSGKVAYQTGFVNWRAAENGFASWELRGVRLNSRGELEFQRKGAIPGTDPYATGAYNGGNYYTGGSYLLGEATSPISTSSFSYKEAIASWNATTPPGSWIEVQIRALFGSTWSKWYILGIWDDDNSTVARHSVKGQADEYGTVYTDTFVALNKEFTTDKFQIRILLFSVDGSAKASVRNAAVAYSLAAPKAATASAGQPQLWNTLLDVPLCSQMVYLDGGNVWCSPTSTSMVLGYLLADTGPCEPRVRAAVEGVFDWIYGGYGNWIFNTAYAATHGLEAYVARFTSLGKVEEYVAAGYPVVISIAWGKGQLTGAPIPSSSGHLMVVVGFDGMGNPIVNDPAAASDAEVRRTYLRAEFEPLWLTNSGGTVYLIYPPDGNNPTIP